MHASLLPAYDQPCEHDHPPLSPMDCQEEAATPELNSHDACDDSTLPGVKRDQEGHQEDCKSLCVRHQRMANGGTNTVLQKVRPSCPAARALLTESAQSIESLDEQEQLSVNTIWSLFSSSPCARRLLILRGLLTIACPSQLTFLQDCLTLEMRLDPLLVLPREVSLKVFVHLDAISLGRAAQVSKYWKDLADDDLLWRTMCEQHIEKKCDKCGWGLPLLGERKRRARGLAVASLAQATVGSRSRDRGRTRDPSQSAFGSRIQGSEAGPSTLISTLVGATSATQTDTNSPRPFKRSKTESPAPSRPGTPPPHDVSIPSTPARSLRPLSIPEIPPTRPWKSVYCERLVIERNWRRGTYASTILTGHTDSITCLQVAEDLPHPTFPILMTGSWDRSVRIWNLESGKEVGVLRGHTRGVRALQFDALKLVTGSMDSTLKIWNWRTGECMRTLRGHTDAVICLNYDKQLLVSGSADSTIRVWDFGTGEGFTLRGHTEWVNSVAIWDSKVGCGTGGTETPDSGAQNGVGGAGTPTSNPEMAKLSSKGKFLISASDDMTIRVWDLYTRECVRVLRGHVAQVQSLRVIEDHDSILPSESLLSPLLPPPPPSTVTCATIIPVPPLPVLALEGEKRPLIVSASLDNTIKIWDVELGTCRRTMFGHIEGVWDVAVDKLRIVSGSHDRTLKVRPFPRSSFLFEIGQVLTR